VTPTTGTTTRLLQAHRPRLRPALVRLVTIGLVIALTTACGAGAGAAHLVGAQPASTNIGPTVVGTPSLPALAPRFTTAAATTATATATSTGPDLQPLVDSITAALAEAERVPPNVVVTQKATAGNQVKVAWIVSTNPSDPKAKDHVRADAVKILTVVKASNLDYGSVLLAATGTILVEEKKKVTVVVRAKYTQPFVRSTDWPTIAPETIFTLCDDKPAVIAPAFS